ncbi:MAG: FMN-binding glutamate synthase family protein [Bdellovibrionia bacterium]
MRKIFIIASSLAVIVVGLLSIFWRPALYLYFTIAPLIIVGMLDIFQKKQTIRRNYPVIGNLRYFMESIRPEISQYFIESNTDGMPFDREKRSIVYQRAKGQLDTIPFGTQLNVYAPDYEWINHSLYPKPMLKEAPRVLVGGSECKQPYSASVFNISAMSYGSLSKNAILALNKGAKMGRFLHNTGEGGISPYHLEPGGDLTWQIGTGYFGCRNADGTFSPEKFEKRASIPNIKMIEIKLSQGAKPGHGGILPGAKVTAEIALIRGVDQGRDVLSPPGHTAFSDAIGLLKFVGQLRALSAGKPIGIKLCVGKRRELFSLFKAMLKTEIFPDFITVDGAEGGTGAAPLEFSNSVGTPLNEGLLLVTNSLVGTGLRKHVKIIAAGKITTSFNVASKIAMGADLCNSARGMLFALGCIQALKCNTNTCPTGVATQDPEKVAGLDVPTKAQRVANYHHSTVHNFLELIAAAGLSSPDELRPNHIQRRINNGKVLSFDKIYDYVEEGSFLRGVLPAEYARAWKDADHSLGE